MRRTALAASFALLSATLAACTNGTSGTTTGGAAQASSTAPTSQTAVEASAAAWEQTVNFAGTGTQMPVQVRLYPLQRLRNRVLLTVDLRSATSTPSFSPFCVDDSCGDLGGISLINTTTRMRFGPLRAGENGPIMTSSTRRLALKAGVTYRFGAIFADPGTSIVAVDLQQAGIALRVPIGSGFPRANLISTRPPGTSRWNPSAVPVGTLVTAPIPAMVGQFEINRHQLVGKIVGGPVNDGPGMVTMSSDAIFKPRSATFIARASALVQRAADLLSARADPDGPVYVVAYTDSLGSSALSRRQAQAVRRDLAARLRQFTVRGRGGGSAHPVAQNRTSMRQDSPSGRALNRRIEVSYLPKAIGDGVAQTAAATSAPATSAPAPSAATAVTGGWSYLRPAAPDSAALIKVGPAQLEPNSRARFTAGIRSITVDGGMTLVSLLMLSDRRANPIGAFSAKGGRRTNVGAFHLVDRTTGQVFPPVYDARNPDRVAGIFTHQMEAGTGYEYTFFTTALPKGLTAVDVALAGLGTATAVPSVRIS
jgi:outer membrane protein OmpA-like peptidoglycan-associated protein